MDEIDVAYSEQLRWTFAQIVEADSKAGDEREHLIYDAVDLSLDHLEHVAVDEKLKLFNFSEEASSRIGSAVRLLLSMVEEHGDEFPSKLPLDRRWHELVRRAEDVLNSIRRPS